MVLTVGFNLVQQVLGNGKPAKSSCLKSIPLEKGFSEQGERKEKRKQKRRKDNLHTQTCPCMPLLRPL